ncbi:putative lysine decarboxylase [Neospora caninum Liverpool]|uniref:Lysine decarboxylase, putative n=1 Tax=Neospora caninum (strain Liverpool) TaxID=572307 RepID=F0VEL6_NEOCL|nr:putative lysine decarboxylase [Neospora caninum Liverpool]CBZ52160.1 putative lysine decarboxylase [Neospora caninum Liverpool]CEL66124.1 TPA: lysine decarboxylase, putative [Neospora caninum Liverpool]|eukprot:XP_003882192.1 putative lysine decarboxylase [Neospora caninum Liverpool]
MLERRGTLRYGAARRLRQFGSRDSILLTPGASFSMQSSSGLFLPQLGAAEPRSLSRDSDSPRDFDVDSAMRTNPRHMRGGYPGQGDRDRGERERSRSYLGHAPLGRGLSPANGGDGREDSGGYGGRGQLAGRGGRDRDDASEGDSALGRGLYWAGEKSRGERGDARLADMTSALSITTEDDFAAGGPNAEHAWLRKADTFTQADEDLVSSETTYVAMLREELWQALSAHVAMWRKEKIEAGLNCLEQIEWFWGAEGMQKVHEVRALVKDNKMDSAGVVISSVTASMSSVTGSMQGRHHCFYVLVVVPPCTFRNRDHRVNLAAELRRIASKEQSQDSSLVYRIVEVDSIRRALLATIVNPDILAVVLQDNVPIEHSHSSHALVGFEAFVRGIDVFVETPVTKMRAGAPVLATVIQSIAQCRSNIDVFCVCTAMGLATLEPVSHLVKRAFFPNDDHSDLHEAILAGVRSKMRCPFFEALRRYAERPIGVFHALAISRGNSVRRSKWIQGLIEFYGVNLFKAESSATCGGLDSLLDPHGSLLDAQNLAARAYDANYAFFVTNGTSTSNKIVLQAVLRPGDVVLVDRDCHKSHHYGFVLAGSSPCYLDAYPLHRFSMYGGVPLEAIKRTLLAYRSAGRVAEVKLLVLTNCTFDGIVYNVKRVVEECLAIAPHLVFLFDEAWFSYAMFHPILKRRTAMHAANEIRRCLMEGRYHRRFQELLETLGTDDLTSVDAETLVKTRLYPDPRRMRVRVYATHSIHKSLTALRQGSMILVNDDLFESHVHTPFKEAYYTHMSTSPNYQILATIDVGRSQMELEGYGLVERQIEAAFFIRRLLTRDLLVRKYFTVLSPRDMIPAAMRKHSKALLGEEALQCEMNLQTLEQVWLTDDEFVLDPTRITLFTGLSGLDGDTFKVKWLMDKYGIQINKTSRNSVLFMTNIGTTRSSCVFLKACIRSCAQELEMHRLMSSTRELEEVNDAIRALVEDCPDLPNFSAFHPAFKKTLFPHDVCEPPNEPSPAAEGGASEGSGDGAKPARERERGDGDQKGATAGSTPGEDALSLVRDGDLRAAFYLAYDEDVVRYLSLRETKEAILRGEQLVATTFVIPYPPGFPVAVPGQVLTLALVDFLLKLDVKEIHGFDHKLGFRLFTEGILNDQLRQRRAAEREKTDLQGMRLLPSAPQNVNVTVSPPCGATVESEASPPSVSAGRETPDNAAKSSSSANGNELDSNHAKTGSTSTNDTRRSDTSSSPPPSGREGKREPNP